MTSLHHRAHKLYPKLPELTALLAHLPNPHSKIYDKCPSALLLPDMRRHPNTLINVATPLKTRIYANDISPIQNDS